MINVWHKVEVSMHCDAVFRDSRETRTVEYGGDT